MDDAIGLETVHRTAKAGLQYIELATIAATMRPIRRWRAAPTSCGLFGESFWDLAGLFRSRRGISVVARIRELQADRLANATYVPLPKPRRIVERPLTETNWCADAIAVLLNPRADEILRTAMLEKARNRGCVN